MKAERGEGTITEWRAIQDWIGHERRFVADNTGNWTDTIYWNKLKDKMYQYEQAYGMKPLLETWYGNLYWDDMGDLRKDEDGKILYDNYSRPRYMSRDGMIHKPNNYLMDEMKDKVGALYGLMARVRSFGAITIGTTVQSPSGDNHIRLFTASKNDVKGFTVNSTVTHKYFHPTEGKKEYTRPTANLWNTGLRFPKSIKYKVTITPEMAQDFFDWRKEVMPIINKMSAQADADRVKSDVNYAISQLINDMPRYREQLLLVADSEEALPEKLVAHADKVAKGRVVADAIIAYHGHEDVSIETINKSSKEVNWKKYRNAYNAINTYTRELDYNSPQRTHDNHVKTLKNLRVSITGRRNRINLKAPIGGEALLNEKIRASKTGRNSDTTWADLGVNNVDEYFAHVEGINEEE